MLYIRYACLYKCFTITFYISKNIGFKILSLSLALSTRSKMRNIKMRFICVSAPFEWDTTETHNDSAKILQTSTPWDCWWHPWPISDLGSDIRSVSLIGFDLSFISGTISDLNTWHTCILWQPCLGLLTNVPDLYLTYVMNYFLTVIGLQTLIPEWNQLGYWYLAYLT